MTIINVDIDLLGDIMLSRPRENAYLDTWTGEAEFLSHAQIRAFLHQGEEFKNLSEDEEESFFLVEQIFSDTENRYRDLPRVPEIVELCWMSKFADRVSDLQLSEKLKATLGNNIVSVAMKKFSAELSTASFEEWHRWRDFRNQKKREAVTDMMSDNGIIENATFRFT